MAGVAKESGKRRGSGTQNAAAGTRTGRTSTQRHRSPRSAHLVFHVHVRDRAHHDRHARIFLAELIGEQPQALVELLLGAVLVVVLPIFLTNSFLHFSKFSLVNSLG